MISILDKTIEEVISPYVELKPSGMNYLRGLCPFHPENTPSFFVSLRYNTYKCFGCGKQGNRYTFPRDIGAQPIAVDREYIPKRTYNTEVGAITGYTEEEKKLIHVFSKNYVYSPAFKKARDYLESRGLTNEVIINSKVGFIPENVDIPNKIWKAKKIVNNLVFPIFDLEGNLVSFSTRSISKKQYIHSLGFKTGENIFYLPYLFNRDAEKKSTVFLCEGFFDVLTPATYKYPAISIFGSNTTPRQIELIKELLNKNNIGMSNLMLSFDNDLAGYICAMETFEKFQVQDMRFFSWENKQCKDVSEWFTLHGGKLEDELNIESQNIIDFFFFAFCGSKEFRDYINKNMRKLYFFNHLLTIKEFKMQFIRKLAMNQDAISIFMEESGVLSPYLSVAVTLYIWKQKFDTISNELPFVRSYLNDKQSVIFGNLVSDPDITIPENLPAKVVSLEREFEQIMKFFDRRFLDFGA